MDSFIEKVIVVDENDNEIGQEEKLKAHEDGLLHRAFSIFIFNGKGQLLLQQRAMSKIHSAGLWTNSCCGHPRPGEETTAAARRRLKEEMGFETDLEEVFSFSYKTKFDNGLIENEFDHVFIGFYDDMVNANPNEAMFWMWIDQQKLDEFMKKEPEKFTYWFLKCSGKALTEANAKMLERLVSLATPQL